jgi:hypothetical protein
MLEGVDGGAERGHLCAELGDEGRDALRGLLELLQRRVGRALRLRAVVASVCVGRGDERWAESGQAGGCEAVKKQRKVEVPRDS